MRAVILAGGRGERLNATGNKCMVMVNNKPILERSVKNASFLGTDIIMVVGYKKEEVMDYFKSSYMGVNISYVVQKKPRGIVHAIECCKDAIDSEDFILMLGDEIIKTPWHWQMKYYFKRFKCFGVCGVVKVSDIKRISKTYSILHKGKRIHHLVEKPTYPFNHLMGTGNCIFKNEILNYIDMTLVNLRRGRKEKELVDLITCAIDENKRVDWFEIGSDYENVNDGYSLNRVRGWKNV